MLKAFNKATTVCLIFSAVLMFMTFGYHWGEPNAVYILGYGLALLLMSAFNYLLDKKQEFIDFLLEERKHRYYEA